MKGIGAEAGQHDQPAPPFSQLNFAQRIRLRLKSCCSDNLLLMIEFAAVVVPVAAFQFIPVVEAQAGDTVHILEQGQFNSYRVSRCDAGRGVYVVVPNVAHGAAPEMFIPFDNIKSVTRPLSL